MNISKNPPVAHVLTLGIKNFKCPHQSCEWILKILTPFITSAQMRNLYEVGPLGGNIFMKISKNPPVAHVLTLGIKKL